MQLGTDTFTLMILYEITLSAGVAQRMAQGEKNTKEKYSYCSLVSVH